MTIELRCLGPLEVRVDGGPPPAELLWRKHLALLVYLARSPRGRARDHLMGLLWPEKDQDKARHSLNEALRVLRRVLGDALVTEGDVVRIEASAIATGVISWNVMRRTRSLVNFRSSTICQAMDSPSRSGSVAR